MFENEVIEEEVLSGGNQEVDEENDLLELEHDDNKETAVQLISEDELDFQDDRSKLGEQEYNGVAIQEDGQPETFENENRLTQIQQEVYDEADDVISQYTSYTKRKHEREMDKPKELKKVKEKL